MNYIEAIQDAIKTGYNCTSKHIGTMPVKEVFQGKTMWEGEVEIFELIDHPKAKKAYGWGYREAKGKTEFVTVLEIPPVTSPESAVKAYLVNIAKSQ